MHFHDIALGYCAWWTFGPQPATRVKRIRIGAGSGGYGRSVVADMPVHAGSLRSGCNCHGPQRQPTRLYYRDGDLRDRYSRVNVANPRP